MELISYQPQFQQEVIDLILHIQNDEAKIALPLTQQPDLLDIPGAYQARGGQFWLAVEHGHVAGTIGLLPLNADCCVLKKFFVNCAFRGQKVGLALYQALLAFAQANGFRHIVLDTPSVARASHRFYERAGFRRITAAQLPAPYTYPDRDSYLYLLDL